MELQAGVLSYLPAGSENSPSLSGKRNDGRTFPALGRHTALEAALARPSFQGRCSRCPRRWGFGVRRLLYPFFFPEALQSIPERHLISQNIRRTRWVIINNTSEVVGAAKACRLCFLLLSFSLLLLVLHPLHGGRGLVCSFACFQFHPQ